MDLVNACMTPRDEIKSYDYAKPIIRGLLTEGFTEDDDLLQDGGAKKKGLGDAMKDVNKKIKKARKYIKKRYKHKKKKIFAMPVSERSQMRQESYRNFVKFIGFIFYLFYLPLKPWIWIMTETIKKFQKIYAGTIVPL